MAINPHIRWIALDPLAITPPAPRGGPWQVDGEFRVDLRHLCVDDPHLRAMAQVEETPHGVIRHLERRGELQLRPAARPHRPAYGEFRGDERRQHDPIGAALSRSRSGQGPTGLIIALEGGENAVEGVGAGFLLAQLQLRWFEARPATSTVL